MLPKKARVASSGGRRCYTSATTRCYKGWPVMLVMGSDVAPDGGWCCYTRRPMLLVMGSGVAPDGGRCCSRRGATLLKMAAGVATTTSAQYLGLAHPREASQLHAGRCGSSSTSAMARHRHMPPRGTPSSNTLIKSAVSSFDINIAKVYTSTKQPRQHVANTTSSTRMDTRPLVVLLQGDTMSMKASTASDVQQLH
jgi:hypothetical protein